MSLNSEQLAAIDAELASGNAIAAIRDYRAFTGADLATAKKFIDARRAELCVNVPDALPERITRVPPDRALMTTIMPSPDREIRSLLHVLNEIEELLNGNGINYSVTLSAKAASLSIDSLPVIETMATLYPESEPGKAKSVAVAIADFESDVTDCLTYKGHASAGPRLSDRHRSRLKNQLIPDLWREIAAIAPLEDSRIVSYSSETGLPGYYVFWFFAYLVHCPSNGRCLVLTGMSSD